MKVLVYPHDLEIGGSQINAVDLAAATARRGHEVCVYGDDGPLSEYIRSLGLEFVPSPHPRRRPSPAVVSDLRAVIRARGIDIVHGYEWPPILESVLAVRGTGARPCGTVMSMSVAGFIPHTMHLAVGTRQIADVERTCGRSRVWVVEPPVDLSANSGSLVDARSFVDTAGLDPRSTLVVSVTRLASELKLEGTLVAIDVVAELSTRFDVQLAIVGDGPERAVVRARADRANDRAGRRVVVMTGALDDPRPAYAAADIALGMGGSALRAMAFGAPLIVQGERGFWCSVAPETVDQFLWAGWYGVGGDPSDGPAQLRKALAHLIVDPDLRRVRGAFGAEVVRSRFGLHAAARTQESIYSVVLDDDVPRAAHVSDSLRASARYMSYFGAQRLARLRGTASVDDFNSAPVARTTVVST